MVDVQEFSFPDAVRLWDTLFSDPGGRTDCLLRTCVAMLVNVRGELLQVCASDQHKPFRFQILLTSVTQFLYFYRFHASHCITVECFHWKTSSRKSEES